MRLRSSLGLALAVAAGAAAAPAAKKPVAKPVSPALKPARAPLPERVEQPAPVTALAFTPDGRELCAAQEGRVLVLDVETGRVVRTLGGHAGAVQALAFSPDGALLAAAGGAPTQSGEVKLWDARSGREVRTLKGHADVVTSLSWKPGSHVLATSSFDKTARVWNADTGAVVRTIKDHSDAVHGVAFSPDGRYLATGSADRTAKVFRTEDFRNVALMTAAREPVYKVGFSRDGKWLFTTIGGPSESALKVYPMEERNHENAPKTHGVPYADMAVSADGQWMAVVGYDEGVRILTGDGQSHRQHLKHGAPHEYSVAFSPDGKLVATGGVDGKVYLWSPTENKLLRTLQPG